MRLLNETSSKPYCSWKCKKKRESTTTEESQSKWILEGDEIRGFFYNCINRRRKANEITGLLVEGDWVEEAVAAKREVNKFFKNHFKRAT